MDIVVMLYLLYDFVVNIMVNHLVSEKIDVLFS